MSREFAMESSPPLLDESPELAVEPSPPARSKEPAALPHLDPETGAQLVQVFYATDREPLVDKSSLVGTMVYAIPLAAAVVTLLLGVATIFLSRRILLGLVTLASLLVTLQLWHSANVKYQRQHRLAEQGDRIYGDDRHSDAEQPLEVGICHVAIPPDHRVGKVESPSLIRLEFSENAEKHVVLQRVMRKEHDEFYEELRSHIGKSSDKQAFAFIHGYNVSFEGAVKRTAQITYDLRFDGAAICYSWPSQGGLTEYTRDEANVTWTVVHLEDFLNQVVARSGARTVHLVAHSMGNRALVHALERIALQQTSPEPIFGQVIMAAPDVDAGEFRDRYAPAVARLARHVTLYASSNDQALLASTKVHGHTRAGLSGDQLVVIPGVDTIDVSPIDTSLIGHSYYGDNPLMIRDMRALVELGVPASSRSWLEQIIHPPTFAHWVFRPEFAELP
jgi:esterase/lipase superfamily enzyme